MLEQYKKQLWRKSWILSVYIWMISVITHNDQQFSSDTLEKMMLCKLKTCQLNSTCIAVNELENNYTQCNGKGDLKTQ